jgi:hypothetical protein
MALADMSTPLGEELDFGAALPLEPVQPETVASRATPTTSARRINCLLPDISV